MDESLIEKAKRLDIKPQNAVGESLLQKAQRLGIKPVNQPQKIDPIKGVGTFAESPLGKIYDTAGREVISNIQKGAEEMSKITFKKAITDPFGTVTTLLRPGLRTVGTVAKTAFEPILQIPVVKSAVEKMGENLFKIPGAKETIQSAVDIAKQYPEQAQDLADIINIITLGGGKAIEAPLMAEGRAVIGDIKSGVKASLTPSEEMVQSKITNLFQRSIKPTAKKTLGQSEKYQNDTINALKTIKSNVDSLNIVDETGEMVVGRTPQTINELAQAIDQTKKTVFSQYDELAKSANKVGATIDPNKIADEIAEVAVNRALEITNPEVVKYAKDWVVRLRNLGTLDTETTQAVIRNLNESLGAFYKNPTYESASKVAIDAGIANNFRKALDTAIENATGKEYQALKNQYSALKAIENDVTRATMRDARKNAKGLLDYTDMFTGGQMLTGILSLNPAMFTKGAVERGFKEYIKLLNDPNRAIKNIFNQLNTQTKSEFVPTSALGKFFQNPKAGLGVSNIAKNITMSEKGTLRDFTDYVNGSYKPDAKTLVDLKRDTQEIVDKYKFTSATKGDKALANQIGEYLDAVGFDRKITK